MSSVPPFVLSLDAVHADQIKHDLLVALDVLGALDNVAVQNHGLGCCQPDLLQNGKVVEQLIGLLGVQLRHGNVGGETGIKDPVGVIVAHVAGVDRPVRTARLAAVTE